MDKGTWPFILGNKGTICIYLRNILLISGTNGYLQNKMSLFILHQMFPFTADFFFKYFWHIRHSPALLFIIIAVIEFHQYSHTF